MKYPQLVSSRAVNEISDWLIKQLEELDIEHPCVYSRFLLSLLHTPLKLNALDLDEIPHLKVILFFFCVIIISLIPTKLLKYCKLCFAGFEAILSFT